MNYLPQSSSNMSINMSIGAPTSKSSRSSRRSMDYSAYNMSIDPQTSNSSQSSMDYSAYQSNHSTRSLHMSIAQRSTSHHSSPNEAIDMNYRSNNHYPTSDENSNFNDFNDYFTRLQNNINNHLTSTQKDLFP